MAQAPQSAAGTARTTGVPKTKSAFQGPQPPHTAHNTPLTPRHTTLHTTPHLTTTHHTTPHHTTPHDLTPHHTTPHQTTSHHIAPHHITPHRTIPHQTTPRYSTSHTASCYATPPSRTLALFYKHGRKRKSPVRWQRARERGSVNEGEQTPCCVFFGCLLSAPLW